jgi:hypothetical protein
MIHELRVFHCVPGRLPALLKRFENDTLRLFEKHGIKQLGFWTVAIGESNNDLFLILQWESLAEREQKFGAFLKDPEWLDSPEEERGRRSPRSDHYQHDSGADRIFDDPLEPRVRSARATIM